MKILDIGIGQFPWIFIEGRLSADLPRKIENGVVYIGINKDPMIVGEVDYSEESIIQENKDLIEGELKIIDGDGTSLEFENNSFDVVILSDVLSVPSHNWCGCESGCYCSCPGCDCSDYLDEGDDEDDGDDNDNADDREAEDLCCGELYRGLLEEDKIKIIDEAIRVLVPGGKLVIAIYQTPEYAFNSYRYLDGLCTKGVLSLEETIDNTWFNDASFDWRGSKERLFIKK